MKSLFAPAWHAILVADKDRRIVDANRSACQLFETSRGKLLRMRLEDLRHDFSKIRYKRLLDAALRPPFVREEYVRRTRDGRQRTLDVIGARIDRYYAIFVFRDVTELKHAAENIRASEEKFRSIIRDAGPGIVYVDLAGVHVDVNDAFCRMTGFSRDELVGRGMPYPYWPKDQISRFTRGMRRALDGGVTVLESVFVKKNGDRLPVRIHPSSVTDHTGAKVGEIAIFEDISSWETLQQELLYAQKMQTVGALAGGIVHEFSNLHCGVRLVIESALAEVAHPLPIRKDLEAALERLDRANSITELLKTFAQRTPSRRAHTSLSEVVREALGIAAATLTKDNVSVEVSTTRRVPELVLDRVQMVQAVLNLILNARDAMLSSETRLLRIETGTWEGRAFVRVSDTGSGIAAEYIGSIFDPFFTTKEDRREQVRTGFGLGLTVSEAIVRDHGGTIDVSSTVGAGSSFTAWLPLDVPPSMYGVSEPVELHARVKGKKIFVAENDTVLRTLLDNALRRAGCVVRTAGSAAQSARLMAGDRFDIAFIDLDLPDEGAEWVLTKIENRKPPDRPVTIFVDDRTRMRGRKKPIRRSAGAILYKPVTLESLYEALYAAAGACDRKRRRGHAPAAASSPRRPGAGSTTRR